MWQRHLACRGEEEPIELCLTPRDLLSIEEVKKGQIDLQQ